MLSGAAVRIVRRRYTLRSKCPPLPITINSFLGRRWGKERISLNAIFGKGSWSDRNPLTVEIDEALVDAAENDRYTQACARGLSGNRVQITIVGLGSDSEQVTMTYSPLPRNFHFCLFKFPNIIVVANNEVSATSEREAIDRTSLFQAGCGISVCGDVCIISIYKMKWDRLYGVPRFIEMSYHTEIIVDNHRVDIL